MCIANWTVALSGGLVLVIAGIISGSAIPSDQPRQPYFLAMVLAVAGYACFAWAVVTLLRFVHRMWTFLPPGFRSLTPMRAVGFLLLPVFNLYWVFRVFAGFARSCNAALANAGSTRRLPVGLFMIFSEFAALALLGAMATIALPFNPVGRAVALATFACAGVSAILFAYIVALASDALALLAAPARDPVTAQ